MIYLLAARCALQVNRCIAELKDRDQALQESAKANVTLKDSETRALADLDEARLRLQSAESELDAARLELAGNMSVAGEAYNSIVKQANERIRNRGSSIELLTDRLNAAMGEVSELKSQVGSLEKDKAVLKAKQSPA